MSKKELRCVLCGKPIDVGQDVARITTGSVKKAGLKADKLWGNTHEKCLLRSLPSSQSALTEITRMARQARSA